ncbi:MAG: hypothetical protein ACREGB_02280 [Candidatus Saccharimonadales bacterium]
MRALVRICLGDASKLYEACWDTGVPPHHNDQLVAELRRTKGMAWARKNYGEPCLDIAGNNFAAISDQFHAHGYSLNGPMPEPQLEETK